MNGWLATTATVGNGWQQDDIVSCSLLWETLLTFKLDHSIASRPIDSLPGEAYFNYLSHRVLRQ
jgi:hypothetical protein